LEHARRGLPRDGGGDIGADPLHRVRGDEDGQQQFHGDHSLTQVGGWSMPQVPLAGVEPAHTVVCTVRGCGLSLSPRGRAGGQPPVIEATRLGVEELIVWTRSSRTGAIGPDATSARTGIVYTAVLAIPSGFPSTARSHRPRATTANRATAATAPPETPNQPPTNPKTQLSRDANRPAIDPSPKGSGA